MRAHRMLLAAVVLSGLGAGAAAHADVVTPVVESGTFAGAGSGLAGCWAERSGSFSYCLVAYDTGDGTATSVRLRGWAWDGAETTPQPVASVDARLPQSALGFGADASGAVEVHLDASVGDP